MNRNRIIFFSIFVFSVLHIGCSEGKTPVFSISGHLDNPQKGAVVLSQEEDINRKQSRIIGDIPVDDKGNFNVGYDLEPHIYTLNFYDKKKIMLAVGKGQKIVVSGDANDLSTIKVSGSDDTAKLQAYESFRIESLGRLVISVRDEIKSLKAKGVPENDSEMLKLDALEIENYGKHKDELIEFIKGNMGSSVSVYATSLRWDGDRHIPFLESLAKAFEKKHPGLAVTSKLSEKVNILKNTSVGGKASEIRMPDKDGSEVMLSSLGAKFILIDFWGSWCGPCRKESKELKTLYDEFKPGGFDIYGVGLESDKEKWLAAIEQDKRIWANVTTLEEFETQAAFDFAVTSLPANFLIDARGKILAKNLHGDELRKILEKLLNNRNVG